MSALDDPPLAVEVEVRRVLVDPTVVAELVVGGDDLPDHGGEGERGVSGDEEGRRRLVAVQQVEDPRQHVDGVLATRELRGVTAPGRDRLRHRVEVEAQAYGQL